MSQFRFQSFSLLPPVIKNLIIINVLMYVLTISDLTLDFGINLTEEFSLFYWKSALFKPWQLVTHMFMHANFTHLLFNMFSLWMFGYTLENIWGSKRFFNFYMISGVGAGLIHLLATEIEVASLVQNVSPEVLEQLYNMPFRHITTSSEYLELSLAISTYSLGASGATYAILMGYGLMFPNSIIHLYLFIPIKVKWFITGLILLSMIGVVGGSSGIGHIAHLGGMLVGYLIIRYWKRNNYLY